VKPLLRRPRVRSVLGGDKLRPYGCVLSQDDAPVFGGFAETARVSGGDKSIVSATAINNDNVRVRSVSGGDKPAPAVAYYVIRCTGVW